MKLRGLAASLTVLAAITVSASGCSEAGASNEENPDTAVTVEEPAEEGQPARRTTARPPHRTGPSTDWSGRRCNRGHRVLRRGLRRRREVMDVLSTVTADLYPGAHRDQLDCWADGPAQERAAGGNSGCGCGRARAGRR